MDFLKKAKSQVKGAVQDAHVLYNQYKQQTTVQDASHGYQSNGHGYHYPQADPRLSYAPQPGHQAPQTQSDFHWSPVQPQEHPVPPPSLPPPVRNPYQMNSLEQALPPIPNFNTQRSVNPGTPCPGHKASLTDVTQFYIFKPEILSHLQPTVAPDHFSVCQACFLAHVSPHERLASNFEMRNKAKPHPDAPRASFEKLTCDFALPSVGQIFFRECLPSQSVAPLLEYARRCRGLAACSGQVMTEPTRYYESRHGDGFGCCESCFESFVRCTAFERDMAARPPETNWYCDLGARGFLYRAYVGELRGPNPNFKLFSVKAKKRGALPSCPGVGIPIAPLGSPEPHFTYEAVGGKTGVFCQACYFDKVLGTSMEPHFHVYNRLEEQYYGNISCDLASQQSSFAMKAAIRSRDDEVWRRCMSGRENLPACSGIAGVDEESLLGEAPRWYCFSEFPSIEVCPFCYCATVEVLGASHLFAPVQRAPRSGIVRMCYLAEASDLTADPSDAKNFENTLVWRGTMLRNWLFHGYDWQGNFYGLQHVAKEIASWPPPCGSDRRAFKPINERKWYGNHFLAEGDENKIGISVCEECFTHYIKGSPLEWFVGVDLSDKTNSRHPDGFACNVPTRRTRDELDAACQEGNFLRFANYFARRRGCEARRQAIDNLCNEQAQRQRQDVAVLNMQNQMASINLMQQLNANMNSTIMGIGGSVAEAAAADHGQRYGNPTVGYGFLTPNGAAAAQAQVDASVRNRGQTGVSRADFKPSGSTWEDTQQVLALARAINVEWDAIK
ncbi:hypothetical protein B0I35DRAFT_497443 [Stachybotrys elegans]|uniref:Integral membrane protein n=1 Tax=Stachybotrys elegans TaxID=80388 RepID=A0A8K0T398_9HYPO|nr:hypothetical protein B0I35DRAFT_497443 [Stachybotrys elegans]